MGAQRASRRTLRRITRNLGVPIVFANSHNLYTTVDHRHPVMDWYGQWHVHTPAADCRWSSCDHLFGRDAGGRQTQFMRGACPDIADGGCSVGAGELHRFGCPRLDRMLEYVPADYWPRPVHRPTYLDALAGIPALAGPPRWRAGAHRLAASAAVDLDPGIELIALGVYGAGPPVD